MPITTIPAFPSRSAGLSQDAYSSGVEASLTATKQAVDDINASASQYNVATSATSTSSVLIGTGSKTFTVASGLGFVVGMTLRIANTSANFMTGEVTSYTSTTLVMNITAVSGSGTLASWNISMAAVGASTAATVSNTPAGNIASTTVQAALNELDTEKLSSSAGAVTDANLSTVATASTTGDGGNIPVVTITAKGRTTAVGTAQKIVVATPVATTSATTQEITGIPSWVKKITVMIDKVSTAGTSALGIQLGDATSYEITGYETYASLDGGSPTRVNPTNLLPFTSAMTAAGQWTGIGTLVKYENNRWAWSAESGTINGATQGGFGVGAKTLTGTLTRLRLTSVSADVFDNGAFNIMYE